jgi:hypothetical protein
LTVIPDVAQPSLAASVSREFPFGLVKNHQKNAPASFFREFLVNLEEDGAFHHRLMGTQPQPIRIGRSSPAASASATLARPSAGR